MIAQKDNGKCGIILRNPILRRALCGGRLQFPLLALAAIFTVSLVGTRVRAATNSVSAGTAPTSEEKANELSEADIGEQTVETPQTSEPDDDPQKDETPPKNMRIIGATARVREQQSGIQFTARVDTGAKTCSLHVDQILIEDESEQMLDNIGKTIRFSLINGKNEAEWCLAKIEKVVRVKSTEGFDRRYKVRLNLKWKDVQKKILVTLNNRDDMEFPLLIGRNFLRGGFLVDVNLDNPEKPQR